MRCLPAVTLPSDQPFWVSTDSFFSFFDQDDFCCRDQAHPVAAYLSEWFYTPEDGNLRFILPAVGIVEGKTQFISGRHRTAVLLPYLEELPLAFALGHLRPDSVDIVNRIPKRGLSLNEQIWLPDLPLKAQLP